MEKKQSNQTNALAAKSDRRVAERVETEEPLNISVESVSIRGRAENVSKSGVLFFTDENLRVTVELEEDGVVKRLSGSVVRLQAMRGQSTGWAVEFDE